MDYYIIGVLIFLACLLASRFINEKGLKKFSVEEKGTLMQELSGIRKYQLIPLIILILGYFFLIKAYPEASKDLLIIYFAFLGIMMFAFQFVIFKKLKKLQLPTDYIKSYILAKAIEITGIIIFFIFLVLNFPK